MKDEVTGWVCLGRRQPRCPQVMCILDQPTAPTHCTYRYTVPTTSLKTYTTLYLILHPWSTYSLYSSAPHWKVDINYTVLGAVGRLNKVGTILDYNGKGWFGWGRWQWADWTMLGQASQLEACPWLHTSDLYLQCRYSVGPTPILYSYLYQYTIPITISISQLEANTNTGCIHLICTYTGYVNMILLPIPIDISKLHPS